MCNVLLGVVIGLIVLYVVVAWLQKRGRL